VTREAPLALTGPVAAQTATAEAANAIDGTSPDKLPNSPDSISEESRYPDAVPVPDDQGTLVVIESDTQSSAGSVYTLDGHASVGYGDRMIEANHIVYDRDTQDATLTGNVLVTGGANDESIRASHAIINMETQTGRFYDVTGSVGIKSKQGATGASENRTYTNSNPFLFSGRLVVKTGPREYQIYDGTLTSCRLAHPDWLLSASEFRVDGEKASASGSVFHLMNLPVLWLPYVTHPVDADQRQSGLLIPEIGINSASKGDTIGEQLYWAINRSTDLTVGSIFYSARGWEQSASFHYRGLGQDFVKSHYSGLRDRGYTPSGGSYINQSGTDVVFGGRRDMFVGDQTAVGEGEGLHTSNSPPANAQTRAVADVEYLSSFPYREAFSSNFNQAVSSDVVSTIYLSHEQNGMAMALEGDRYQGEKRVASSTQTEEQVHIFHAPAVEFAAVDHELGVSGFEWNMNSSVAMLKRIQSNFVTGGMIERVDVRPELARPFSAGGWRVRPSVAARETFYSRSRLPEISSVPEVESLTTLNREDVEVQVDLRPPLVERTFDDGFVRRLLRHDVKHTIEPEFTYRYASGIDNFQQVLRFDEVDVASNTNELEYGVTQRLFLRRSEKNPCRTAGTAADATEVLNAAGGADAGDPGQATNKIDQTPTVCGNREWISWRVAQKYFFDPSFGGAVVEGKRNIFGTTLDFSGIAFLTEPRNISPLVSRLRVRTSEKTDLEWDFDYDTGAKKFTANNIYADAHRHDFFAGVSFARLNAPGRAYVEGVASSVAEFEQMRTTLGFGKPTRAGLSVASSAGIDLDLGTPQYGSIEAAYNWDCCGVSVEYQKYELGSARNDGGVKFSFTLANIGSAGNLRRSSQLF
jgi:LPS-assembly protein